MEIWPRGQFPRLTRNYGLNHLPKGYPYGSIPLPRGERDSLRSFPHSSEVPSARDEVLPTTSPYIIRERPEPHVRRVSLGGRPDARVVHRSPVRLLEPQPERHGLLEEADEDPI